MADVVSKKRLPSHFLFRPVPFQPVTAYDQEKLNVLNRRRANIIAYPACKAGGRRLNMKLLLIATLCMIVVSGPALACRGTSEYPQAFQRLEKSTLSSEKRNQLKERLDKGQAIHRQGHLDDDKEKRRESLRILDAVKQELGM